MRSTFCIAISALALSACGGGDQSGTVEGEDGETVTYSVDQDGDTYNLSVNDDSDRKASMQVGDDIAAEFPAGFSLYPGASVTQNATFSEGDGVGVMIGIQSSDPAADLIAFYRAQAVATGIAIDSEGSTSGMRVVSGSGPDDVNFTLSAVPSGGGTMATFNYAKGM